MKYIFLIILVALNFFCGSQKAFAISNHINMGVPTGIEYFMDSKFSINLNYLRSYYEEKNFFFGNLYDVPFYTYNAPKSSTIITGIKYRF